MPRPTRAMMGRVTGIASSIVSPIRSGYASSGIKGAIGGAKKPLMYGGGILGAGNIIRNRRQGGLDRTVGRPTGMYKY